MDFAPLGLFKGPNKGNSLYLRPIMRDEEDERFLDKNSRPRGPCIGTSEGARIWCNTTDNTGILFASIVWIAILFAASVLIVVYLQGELEVVNFAFIMALIGLALWAHLKTMTSDPGAVPCNAHPTEKDTASGVQISMCGRCDGYKPPMSHHDRISNRCISRMDHFCPWMNNAIGAKNQKDFFLFLIYTDLASIYMYIILALHLVSAVRVNCLRSFSICTNNIFAVSLDTSIIHLRLT